MIRSSVFGAPSRAISTCLRRALEGNLDLVVLAGHDPLQVARWAAHRHLDRAGGAAAVDDHLIILDRQRIWRERGDHRGEVAGSSAYIVQLEAYARAGMVGDEADPIVLDLARDHLRDRAHAPGHDKDRRKRGDEASTRLDDVGLHCWETHGLARWLQEHPGQWARWLWDDRINQAPLFRFDGCFASHLPSSDST